MNIDEIKERLAKATGRPWRYSVENGTDQPATLYGQDDGEEIDIAEFEVWDSELHAPEQVANAELIVNAPDDIADLIEAVEAGNDKLRIADDENCWLYAAIGKAAGCVKHNCYCKCFRCKEVDPQIKRKASK